MNLVWIHGNDLGPEFYAPVRDLLAERGHTSVMLDIPGFSGTPALDEPSWDGIISHLTEKTREHIDGPTVLLGHSFGGMLALLTAARLKTSLDKLILLEPAIFPWKLTARAFGRGYSQDTLEKQREKFSNHALGFQRIFNQREFPQWAMDHYLKVKAISDTRTPARLMQTIHKEYPLPYTDIVMPTLLVRGEFSGMSQRVNIYVVARSFPDAKVKLLRETSHFLFNEDNPGLAEIIGDFL